jgi:hypothetical protein
LQQSLVKTFRTAKRTHYVFITKVVIGFRQIKARDYCEQHKNT